MCVGIGFGCFFRRGGGIGVCITGVGSIGCMGVLVIRIVGVLSVGCFVLWECFVSWVCICACVGSNQYHNLLEK